MKKEIKPEYQSLTELIATMKEVVHREYFSGIKEQVVINGIELWMREAARIALSECSVIYKCGRCNESSATVCDMCSNDDKSF